MKPCYAPPKYECRDRECGNCYRMENSVARYAPYFTCKYMNEQPAEPKPPEVHGFLKKAWGLIECSKCFRDFPGAARTRKLCPVCGAEWVDNEY